MQEISTEPASTKARIGINDSQLQELFVIIPNARITEAIVAYKARNQLTQTFIAKYYGVVLFDVEAILDERSLLLFRAYMNDRRRLANAGMTSWGSPVQNISAGTDTIKFHCRTN